MHGYTLTLHACCGMAQPIGDDGMDRDDARQQAARLIRRWCQNFPITVIEKAEWAVEEPEDGGMVPDGCGVLILRDPGVGMPL
jgi:hypothetical protein